MDTLRKILFLRGKCVPSCRKEHFRLSGRATTSSSSNLEHSTFYLFFHDVHGTHSRQFIIYDFNAVINGIGGSMGLFLGSSVMGMVGKGIQWATGSKK